MFIIIILLGTIVLIVLAIIISKLLRRIYRDFITQIILSQFNEYKSIIYPDEEKNASRMAGDITTDAPLPKNNKKKSSKIKSATKAKIRKYLDID